MASLPAQSRYDVVGIREIVEKKIGLVFGQAISGPGTSRYRDSSGAKYLATGDVVSGVADDVDSGRVELVAVRIGGPTSSERTQLIAIMVIIGKRAELEVIPQTVVLQLELRPASQIAGQQSEDAIRPAMHPCKDFFYTGKDATGGLRQGLGQMHEVFIEKSGDVALLGLNSVFLQNCARNARVGASGNLDVIQLVFFREAVLHHPLQGLETRATAVDEGRVNIPEKKALRHFRLEEPRRYA